MCSRKPLRRTSSTSTTEGALSKAGIVLVGVMMLTLVVTILGAGLLFAARQSMTTVNRWHDYDAALLAAQTAVEKAKSDLHNGFRDFHESTYSWNNINWLVEQATNYSVSTTTLSELLDLPEEFSYPYDDAMVEVVVEPSPVFGTYEEKICYITNTVTATYKGVARKIREVFYYKLSKSTVFDHAYFMNNFGWWYGVNIVVNGDIRSNYDMTLRSSRLVLNGDSYAYGMNNVEQNFKTWSASTYRGHSNHQNARPFYHVDQNYANEGSLFEKGYDYTDSGNTYDAVPKLPMPYIGNLGEFIGYAQHKGGTISLGGAVVVDAVYDGVGPSGIAGAPDEGCLVLEGTVDDPIVINGPVVINKDVIIRGYYTGQGTIYAGRNMHIIDDLIAVNPPEWNHPDSESNFKNNTLPDNMDADFLGLCAKGSMALGDYNGGDYRDSRILKYSKPPFTAEYSVSATDTDIGYAQYQKEDGKWYFDGDYTATFGEKGDDANPSQGVPRKYYESSLSDAMFDALSPAKKIRQIDGFIYNNHLLAGTLNAGVVNGGLICRDEALYVNGVFHMNWDCRVGEDDSEFKPYLPMALVPATTILWWEMAP